jgi:tetratricopeptide (TPR) repeat protein
LKNEKPSLQTVNDLVKEGRFEEALKEVWKVLVNEPENTEALFYSGGCYFRLGDYKNARLHWERLLYVKPDHEKARAMLAKIDSVEASASTSKPIAKETPKPAAPKVERPSLEEESNGPPTEAESKQPGQPSHKSANLKYCPQCGKETLFSVVPPPAWLTTVLGQHGHKTWKMKWRCQTCGHIKEGGIG